jgi:hypothetical protein
VPKPKTYPTEIDVSDIESLPAESLDPEQRLRAERAGLLDRPGGDHDDEMKTND